MSNSGHLLLSQQRGLIAGLAGAMYSSTSFVTYDFGLGHEDSFEHVLVREFERDLDLELALILLHSP